MTAIETGTVMVDGVSTFFRRVPGEGPPVVFVHGNPTHSEDWQPFLERIPGPALAFDLPGWGRSARPSPGEFDYSMNGLARFVKRFLQRMAVDKHSLVVHDWGAVADRGAGRPRQASPAGDRQCRSTAPRLPLASHGANLEDAWPGRALEQAPDEAGPGLRAAGVPWRPKPPRPRLRGHDMGHLDGGTLTAVLHLYRSADPDRLAAAGERLGSVAAPTLVVWGCRDRYLPSRFGRAYAARLPNAEFYELDNAGHWPWIDAPEVVDRVVRFMASDEDFRRA